MTSTIPFSAPTGVLAVEGSFDYMRQGLLYIAAHLPDPRDETYADDADREVEALVDAAGGRALVLTTSYAAMRRFAEHLSVTKPYSECWSKAIYPRRRCWPSSPTTRPRC